MSFGAAEDVVRAPDLVVRQGEDDAAAARRVLGRAGHLPVAAGPGRADREPSSRSSGTSPAPPSSRASGSTSRSTRRARASTPLTPEAREQFAAYVTALMQQLPSVEDVIVGNEPNLNRFWLPQFNPDGTERGRAGLPRAARPLVRRAQGGRPDDCASGAARSHHAASTGREPAATRTRPSRSSGTWAPPTGRAAARCR